MYGDCTIMTWNPLYRRQQSNTSQIALLSSLLAPPIQKGKPSLCFVALTPQAKQSSMASRTSGTIIFGFAAVFCCLELLEATTKIQASHSRFARLAAAVFVTAILTTLGLTLLLLFSYVRALGANAAGGRFLRRLAKATLLTAMAVLLAGAVMCLVVASGYLGGANDDVGWLHRKK